MAQGVTQLPTAGQAPAPPANLEAEESVLGALMLASAHADHGAGVAAALRDAGLEPGHFYRETHALIYRAAVGMIDRGEPADAITLADELALRGQLEQVGGKARVHELSALVPATSNAGHYARLIVEQAQIRDLIRVGQELQRLAYERPGETDALLDQARGMVAEIGTGTAAGVQFAMETWAQFERSAAEQVPTLIDELWPEGALGFIAAPPKKGKTWIGIDLALAVATGTPFLNRFPVPEPQPVVLLALEGHRAAIRGRIGCLARGRDLDPHDPIPNLHVVYKPRGLNLNDPAWVRVVRDAAVRVDARLIVVDVLRRAAVLKENSNDDWSEFVIRLDPVAETGCAIALLHHFGKLTEITKERTPGERMAGAGAMYGAFDVGVFITGSESGARRLRVEFESRDLAAPDTIGCYLAGEPTGKNGGFVFGDAARWELQETMPDEAAVKATAAEIADWVREQGGDVAARDVRIHFDVSPKTLDSRLSTLWMVHQIEYVGGRGREARLVDVRPPDDPQLQLDAPESENGSEPADLFVVADPAPAPVLEPAGPDPDDWE